MVPFIKDDHRDLGSEQPLPFFYLTLSTIRHKKLSATDCGGNLFIVMLSLNRRWAIILTPQEKAELKYLLWQVLTPGDWQLKTKVRVCTVVFAAGVVATIFFRS